VRRAFDAAYRTRFNEEPGVLSDTGYDAAALLIQGWATVGRPDGAAMMKWLRSVKDYAGASGKLSFLPSGDVVKEYRLRTVQEKKFAWLSAQ
jgi:ABC-type branched-subunit amino acid transport system substrate-binding protein